MNRRALLKSALLAIAATASGLRVAEAGIALVEPEEIPLMCLQIGDQKIWLYDGDNKFNEGFASGTARLSGSGGKVSLERLNVFNNTNDRVNLETNGDLDLTGYISVSSHPENMGDGHTEYMMQSITRHDDGDVNIFEVERMRK